MTGKPLVEALDSRRIADLVRGEGHDPAVLRWLRGVWRALTGRFLGLPIGVDPLDPGQAGWGVVFSAGETERVKAALAPLIEHRRARIGKLVKELDYRPGEEWRGWLARHGAEPGSVLPHRVPYYLLLVGDPVSIPYELERLLSVEYAVGRLGFETADEYRLYAQTVIDYETSSALPNGRTAVFFAAQHDEATQLSAEDLVKPLAEGCAANGGDPAAPGVAERWGFSTRMLRKATATKADLAEVFTSPAGTKPPALLFSATHGMGWPKGDPRQRPAQGALLCQDNQAFAAADLPDDARVHGMICFHFACYGLGTPQRDDFLYEPGKPPPEIAEQPFIARLPQRLLAHPRGGALAVLGHVERAWGYSIVGASGEPQLLPFRNAIGSLLDGRPVGSALKGFRERYAVFSTQLADLLANLGRGATVPDDELAEIWVERNDARNYGLLGDPAARLRVEALA